SSKLSASSSLTRLAPRFTGGRSSLISALLNVQPPEGDGDPRRASTLSTVTFLECGVKSRTLEKATPDSATEPLDETQVRVSTGERASIIEQDSAHAGQGGLRAGRAWGAHSRGPARVPRGSEKLRRERLLVGDPLTNAHPIGFRPWSRRDG